MGMDSATDVQSVLVGAFDAAAKVETAGVIAAASNGQ